MVHTTYLYFLSYAPVVGCCKIGFRMASSQIKCLKKAEFISNSWKFDIIRQYSLN